MAVTSSKKKNKSFPLRLSPTLRQELETVAKREGVSINQLICLAVAEKITRVDFHSDLEERKERSRVAEIGGKPRNRRKE